MADGVVVVPPDGTGKSIDTSELTRGDGVTVVERQRIVLSDDSNVESIATITTDGKLNVALDQDEVVLQLKRIAVLLQLLVGQNVSISDIASYGED